MIEKKAFLSTIGPAIKSVGGVTMKALGPLFVSMEAMGAAKKARQPFSNIGPARNLTQTWKK